MCSAHSPLWHEIAPNHRSAHPRFRLWYHFLHPVMLQIVGRGLWELVENLAAVGSESGSSQAQAVPGPQAFKSLVNGQDAFPTIPDRTRGVL